MGHTLFRSTRKAHKGATSKVLGLVRPWGAVRARVRFLTPLSISGFHTYRLTLVPFSKYQEGYVLAFIKHSHRNRTQIAWLLKASGIMVYIDEATLLDVLS
jgi:hypothetical protein